LLTEGSPRNILRVLKQDLFHAYYPEDLIQELHKAPLKAKLASKLSAEDITELLALLARKAKLVEYPKDNVYLACAEATAPLLAISLSQGTMTYSL